MKFACLVALALSVAAVSAFGSEGAGLRQELARCAMVHDALDRLECFDRLTRSLDLVPSAASRSPASRPQETPRPGATTARISAWTVRIRRDDKGAVHEVTLQNRAAQGVGIHGAPVSLTLRCLDREASAFVDWESYVGSGTVPVTITLDGSHATKSDWRISLDGTKTYYPRRARPFIESLLEGGRLEARVNPYGGHEISASFDLSGLAGAISPLREACNWR